MTYRAVVNVMLKPQLLDTAGRTLQEALVRMGMEAIETVRMGKRLELTIDASDAAKAQELVQKACDELFVNSIIEVGSFELEEVK